MNDTLDKLAAALLGGVIALIFVALLVTIGVAFMMLWALSPIFAIGALAIVGAGIFMGYTS
jgi:hypothetical protein